MSATADGGPSVSAVASDDQRALERPVCDHRPPVGRSLEATAPFPATSRIRSAPVAVARAAHPAVQRIGRQRGLTGPDGSRPQAHRRGETVTLNNQTKPGAARGRLSGQEIAGLVRSAAAGDERGWEALVQEFGAMVWAVARAHRLRDADAADVAQTTWVRLLEHLGDLKDPARVGAWLATTARRECLRVIRRECLRVIRHGVRHVQYEDDAPENASRDMPPDEVLLVAERDRALWRSFSRLRPSDQALLRLLMANPRPSYEEISAVLEIPIGSIGPTRARALERLRQELDSEETLTLMTA
jgi:RNA polymerase sigma factor (sigma-70 family)